MTMTPADLSARLREREEARLLEYIEKCLDAAYHEGAASRPLNAAGAINNAAHHAKLVMGELGPMVLATLRAAREVKP